MRRPSVASTSARCSNSVGSSTVNAPASKGRITLAASGEARGTARPSAGVHSAVQAEMQSMQVRLARQVCDDLLDQTYTH